MIAWTSPGDGQALDQRIRYCTTPDGVRIAWAESGAGPTVVKAANWLNDLEFEWQSPVWRHYFVELSRGHRLVRYDTRGSGLSDWQVEDITPSLFFRDLGYGKVKVSFRSTGDVDVNRFARQFGGGGHAKAAGALITGSMEDVRMRVISAARSFVSNGASGQPMKEALA